MKTEKCLADLQLEVIYNDKCIKCGSCGAFCPNIFFEEGNVKYREQCSETVGVCYNFCPRGELNLPAIDKKLFGQAREDQALGVYQKAVNTSLKDKSLKDVATALLVAAMEENMLDSVVTADASVEKRLEPKICKNKDELLIHAGERKGLGPIVWGAGEAIRNGFEKIAVVGRPCHAQGLGKILKNEDFIVEQDKIKMVISYFCLAQGKGCNVCMDYTGEFADISIDPKSGDMLIRSDMGMSAVNKAVEKGYISISDIDPTSIREASAKKKVRNFRKVLSKNRERIDVGYLQLDIGAMKLLSKE